MNDHFEYNIHNSINVTYTKLLFPLQQPIAIILVVIFIILLTPIIFKRIRIPHIVGLIIAGIVIGPYGFNILERDASFEIFGQVGILYLMFLAGVEIDMIGMKRYWKQGLVFGILSFIIPMIAGIFSSRCLPNVGWSSSVLMASMYASHTLISYPTVARFGLSGHRSVIMAVTGTVVAILGSLIALAEVVSMHQVGYFSITRLSLLLGGLVIYMIVLGYGIPTLTRFMFRKYHDNVTHYIYVLAVMFVCSILAQLIGLEAILGAFYAGLVLNRYIPHRSGLMSKIGFIGNAIFIPYFLIGVGMLINIRIIFESYAVLYIAVTMTFVSLIGKWIAAWLTQRIYGMEKTDRSLLFGLSSGKAAATIAATMVGYRYGLITEDVMNAAVVMILICCIAASVTTERSAMKQRMNLTDYNLHNDDIGPSRVNARQLVAVSNPITAQGLMKLAIFMRHPANKLPIISLFVRTEDESPSISMGREAIQQAVRTAIDVDIKAKDVERYDVNIVSGLIGVAKERNISDIFIGMHVRSNIVDSFLGNTTEQLLESTHKMVIMSRCYMPVNTIARLVVFVPKKAEYETGFTQWVTRIGNLATQLSCKVIFIAYPDTIPYINGVLKQEEYNISKDYLRIDSWDDFIMRTGTIHDNDLLIVIAARRTSISFNTDLEQMPTFLNRYFSRHNLLILYPEQFGSEVNVPAAPDVLTSEIGTTRPSVWETLLKHIR